MAKATLPDDHFDPEQYRTPDGELEASAIKQPTRRQKEGFFPVFPVKIVRAVVEAKALKALPLVLAIHRQLHMTKQKSVPLTGAIWDAAGYVSRKDKTAALQKLRMLSKVIRLISKHQTMHSYYVVAYGPLWKRKGA